MTETRQITVGMAVYRIDSRELDAIRRAVVDYLAATPNELNRQLVAELEGSIAVVGVEEARIGRWVLNERDGHLALTRIPARSVLNYLFVARLIKAESRWKVTDFHQERMDAR